MHAMVMYVFVLYFDSSQKLGKTLIRGPLFYMGFTFLFMNINFVLLWTILQYYQIYCGSMGNFVIKLFLYFHCVREKEIIIHKLSNVTEMDQNDDNRESQGWFDKVKQRTRNMAHSVSVTYSSPKVQSRMALAKGGLRAFVLAPFINLLNLVICQALVSWGFWYKSIPMQSLGIYLHIPWVLITYVGYYNFYNPQPSSGFSPKITRCFRRGCTCVVLVGAMIIFGISCKLNFFDPEMELYFEIDQTLLILAGYLINAVNMLVMRQDKDPCDAVNPQPIVINVFRHLVYGGLGGLVSMLVHRLDQLHGFNLKRDFILLSYYFWLLPYWLCNDFIKFIKGIRTLNLIIIYRRPEGWN